MSSRKKYARLGDDYHWQQGWWNGAYGKWVKQALDTLPEAGEDQTVLEAGCGDGYPASLLVKRGYLVHGVDELEGPLAVARKRVPVGTFTKDWPGEAFDYVLALEAIQHMADPEELMLAVQRCQQFAIVTCPLPGKDAEEVQGYGPADIRALFAGCKVEHLVNDGDHQLYKITPERRYMAHGGARSTARSTAPERRKGSGRVKDSLEGENDEDSGSS